MEQPVETLEGWYCEHLSWHFNWQQLRQLTPDQRQAVLNSFQKLNQSFASSEPNNGSHYWFLVNGFHADLGLMILRPQLEDLSAIEVAIAKSILGSVLMPAKSFVSVTEVGTYTGKPKSDRGWAYVNAHLKPQLPQLNYICFYPMNKRRWPNANWYQLPYEERQKEIREHGKIGRSYAGKIKQYITGAIGLDDDEWGVTLFADDILEIKRIVTEMRYAAASAIYGDFPYFIVGSKVDGDGLAKLLLDNWEG